MILIVITPRAESDMGDIWLSIARDNPTAADKVIRTLSAAIRKLESHPRLGLRRRDVRPSARALLHMHYIILYETQPDSDEGRIDQVEIVRVVDGRRDLTSLF